MIFKNFKNFPIVVHLISFISLVGFKFKNVIFTAKILINPRAWRLVLEAVGGPKSGKISVRWSEGAAEDQ